VFDLDVPRPRSAPHRTRARWFVAIYGVTLVVLLVLGAWLAPADAAGDAATAPDGTVEGGSPPAAVR
jgi:heme A synthase